MELFLKKLLYISEQTKRYDQLIYKKGTLIITLHDNFHFSCSQVAIICNHQRSVSKSHDAQMTRLNEKIDDLKVRFLLQVINSCFYHGFFLKSSIIFFFSRPREMS